VSTARRYVLDCAVDAKGSLVASQREQWLWVGGVLRVKKKYVSGPD
jgi:hypothetical protein